MAQDLQVAQITLTTNDGVTTGSSTMVHKMGLARIKLLKSLQNVTDVTNTTTKQIERTIADAGDLYATEDMESGYPVPLHVESEDVANESKAYYYVVPTSTTTFRGLTSDANRWQSDIEVTLAANTFGDYSASRVGGIYSYTGDFQFCWSGLIFEVPFDGKYQIECWGAQGGGSADNGRGGYGGYTKGVISLSKDTKFYIFVGNSPARNTENSFNGGGQANNTHYPTDDGGGATDVRIVADEDNLTVWNGSESLSSRIMVAGAGGGGSSFSSKSPGGAAGGLIAYNGQCNSGIGASYVPIGGKQDRGGTGDSSPTYKGYAGGFGYGGNGEGYNTTRFGGGGGGSGYYGGGGGGNGMWVNSGAGGSSFISGHEGCIAIMGSNNRTAKNTGTALENSTHYSRYTFEEGSTLIIDGSGYAWTTSKGSLSAMPNPAGGYYTSGAGHQGNGRCKITYIP